MILTRFFHQSSCRSDLPTHLVQRYLDPLEKISGFDGAALYYRRYDPIFLARHFWPRYYKRPISGVKVPPRASQAPSWVPSYPGPMPVCPTCRAATMRNHCTGIHTPGTRRRMPDTPLTIWTTCNCYASAATPARATALSMGSVRRHSSALWVVNCKSDHPKPLHSQVVYRFPIIIRRRDLFGNLAKLVSDVKNLLHVDAWYNQSILCKSV